MIEIFNKEVGQLKRSQQIHSSLIDAVLHGGGLKAIADTLSKLLECSVFIEDDGFNILAYCLNNKPIDELSREIVNKGKLPKDIVKELETKKILDEVKKYQKPHRILYRSRADCLPRIITPIILNSEIYGYIVIIENIGRKSISDLIIAEQAADIAALEIMKNQALKEAEGKIRMEFLEDVLRGKIKDEYTIKNRFKLYGVNLKKNFAIIVISLDYDTALKLEKQNFLPICDVFGKNYNNYFIFRKNEEIIVIYSFINGDKLCDKYKHLERLCDNIYKLLVTYTANTQIGASDIYDMIDKIPQSYYEAKYSVMLLDKIRLKNKSWTLYKDVWIYDLLLSHDDLNRLCAESIRRLIKYDKKNNENLLNTLKVYLDNMGRNKVTSDKLFIHRNTLKYRLDKIQEIMECDLRDPLVRLRIELSFRILNIIK